MELRTAPPYRLYVRVGTLKWETQYKDMQLDKVIKMASTVHYDEAFIYDALGNVMWEDKRETNLHDIWTHHDST